MRVLVTGASGFIGGHVVKRLDESADHEVVCALRRDPENKLWSSSKVHIAVGDMSSALFLDAVTKDIDVIIHAAGRAGDWGSYADFYEGNVALTQRLLSAAQKNGVQRFINISSPSVYFDFKDLYNLKEDDLPKKLSNVYAQTKYEAENLVQSAHSERFATVSLRPRFVIGAGDQQILPRLLRLQEAKLLFQIGRDKKIIDTTHVDNLVDGIMLCLNAPVSVLGDVYNISDGAPVVFWDLVDTLGLKLGISTKRFVLPRGPLLTLARINEWVSIRLGRTSEPKLLPIPVAVLSQSMTLNIEKAKNRLHYVPRKSSADAVDDFAKWWKEQNKDLKLQSPQKFHNFADFWPYYLSQHSHPTTRILHFAGITAALSVVGFSLRTNSFLWLLAVPVVGYTPAWIGHFFVEKNKPATFNHPFYSFRGDLKMCGQMFCSLLSRFRR